jgi:hypothetical protein
MTTVSYRGLRFLGLSALLVLAHVGDAFVNKPSTTLSLSTKTKLPNPSNLPANNVFSNDQQQRASTSSVVLMATENDKSSGGLPFWLDPGTRGGAVVLSLILFILPLVGYSVATNLFGVDGVEAGKYIGVGFTALATLVWVFTYIFRVATKDMTYVSTAFESAK